VEDGRQKLDTGPTTGGLIIGVVADSHLSSLIKEGMDSNVAPAVRRDTDDGFKVATRSVLQDSYGDSTLDNESEQGSLSEDPPSLPDPLVNNIQSPNKGSVSSASQQGSKAEWPPP
jgi:hypothetical protein